MSQKRAIIPNSFTMTNMVLGFIAIIIASNGSHTSIAVAGVLVFVASFFDFIDGATARALGVSSPVGLQLDSLADAVAYGIAPGFISYQAYLCRLPEIAFGINWGMVLAPIFPICATYRLARFNADDSGNVDFSGLPSPAAGIFITSIPALYSSRIFLIGKIDFSIPIEIFVPIFAIVALLMVSTIDYSKVFTHVVNRGKLAIIICSVIIVVGLFYFNMWLVFVLTGVYILAGVFIYLFHLIFGKRDGGDGTPKIIETDPSNIA